ncbi:MAG: hypothetical protein QXH24_02285 [Candidatus Bathyarchaeia archaeon]
MYKLHVEVIKGDLHVPGFISSLWADLLNLIVDLRHWHIANIAEKARDMMRPHCFGAWRRDLMPI